MSESPYLNDEKDVEDLTDEELLERIAALDEEQFPLVKHAKRALGQEDSA